MLPMSFHRVDVFAISLLGLGAPTAPPVVTPAHPEPSQAVTVSFVAPVAAGDGSRWYDVEVTGPKRSSRCEFYEEAEATVAAKGQKVTLTLRPVDKGRWCDGEYIGTLTLQRRSACDDRIDEYLCYDEKRLAAVRFTVDPRSTRATSTHR
jgi:hypothetical protein